MMRLLHWVMAPHSSLPPFPKAWGAPPTATGSARFSVLYSDIGDFYSLCGPREELGEGWTIRGAVGTVWKLESESTEDETPSEWVDISGVTEMLEADTPLMKEDVIKSAKSTGRTSFAFLPWDGVGVAQIHRVLLGPPIPPIDRWGVALKGDPGTFAVWTVDNVTLLIIRIRATRGTFPELLRKVFGVAREYGMQTVEVWNLPEELVEIAGRLGGKTGKRDEHLPAFQWYGDEKVEEIEWIFNEK